jgi:hypothetical protein
MFDGIVNNFQLLYKIEFHEKVFYRRIMNYFMLFIILHITWILQKAQNHQ